MGRVVLIYSRTARGRERKTQCDHAIPENGLHARAPFAVQVIERVQQTQFTRCGRLAASELRAACRPADFTEQVAHGRWIEAACCCCIRVRRRICRNAGPQRGPANALGSSARIRQGPQAEPPASARRTDVRGTHCLADRTSLSSEAKDQDRCATLKGYRAAPVAARHRDVLLTSFLIRPVSRVEQRHHRGISAVVVVGRVLLRPAAFLRPAAHEEQRRNPCAPFQSAGASHTDPPFCGRREID